ncbi:MULTISPECIES: hypothetical protein [Azospira]|jgi:hypothetical protein|uniref:Uncharacterized protein n=1 Tax=Azospira oryzae (strain ATCC BAA-33 / DSM 13638 / PS) TaxID=640081 RepID=G8QN99_AZOOP|nr:MULTISPECIES: hypothetical protein [Azospira]AEV24692.1 hypothetical protein Dsui_0274 [Azospira oryzae PS]MDK9691800.1 hypothetical protein [Azospira sp.]BBN88788.1 hypothetical protein AZSP09_18110 [Azospira sp. I09]
MNANVCIGIRIDGDQLQLAARQQGRALGQVSFSRDSVGRRALASYLAAWEAPLRLAVAAGAAGIALAVALGDGPGREVYLVAASIADQPAALARYAEQRL